MNDSALGGPYNQPSDVSPNFFLPCIYVAHVNNSMHFPGDTAITNVSPVPATAQGRVAKAGWVKPVIGGDRVTRAVRPFTRWRNYADKASN
jgi:hypothetical protein